MPLSPGTKLGVYEVTAKIGAGGMGEVYRAHDTSLDRDVAIKVLPDAFATDPERLARFEREAKVLASLNHPNIAAIYGLEKSGDTPALVLELVEGPTLAEMLSPSPSPGLRPSSPPEGERGKGKPLPLEEALPIARQIAEALEAAHEQGIIHRDLKPANVKVKSDGTVKVLDFGLAKALGPDLSDVEAANSPTMTMTAAATKMGVIMGTAAYMSPEQAKGRQVDKRADIWAFGVVLYEMLTGRQAFGGTDISETLAFVLTRQIEWTALPTETPASVRRLLRRCVERERKNRLADMSMARLEIDEADAAPEAPEAPATASSSGRDRLTWAAVGLALGALVIGRRLGNQPAGFRPAARRDPVPDRSAECAARRGLTYCLARWRDDRLRRATRRLAGRRRAAPPPDRQLRNGHSARHRGRAGAVLLARQSVDRLLRRRRAAEDLDRRRRGDHRRRRDRTGRGAHGRVGARRHDCLYRHYGFRLPARVGGWRHAGAADDTRRGRRRDQPEFPGIPSGWTCAALQQQCGDGNQCRCDLPGVRCATDADPRRRAGPATSTPGISSTRTAAA